MKTILNLIFVFIFKNVGAQITSDSMPVAKPQDTDPAIIVKPTENVEKMPVAVPQELDKKIIIPKNELRNKKSRKRQKITQPQKD